ncbi:hypothetical protein PINS_up007359 [Pythium insidiosum]|nr:hypothetical protein PINS_up007359 [Pythium insidiosum]
MQQERWLPHERAIVEELQRQDALLVMGKGLGLYRVLSYFVRLYASPQTLVLGLNMSEYAAQFHQLALALGLDRRFLPKVLDAKSSVSERMQLYKQGGCCLVTSRILVVDLLNQKLDSKMITGLLVNDAHRVTETSVEAFVLRVYRDANREGFIKAFSDDPVALSAGFSRMEQVLKQLYLRQVSLYPRFHVDIHESLSRRQPAVYEIEVAFSPRMKTMQEAILVALDATMKELQRSTKALDASELTMERALHKSFSSTIRRQLDPVWHKLAPKTKQLVGDLTTLRQLLSYLPRYDAISFYGFLVNYQTMNGQQRFPSPWLFTEAADRLLFAAKGRLYEAVDRRTKQPIDLRRIVGGGDAKNAEMRLTLEGNPKWTALAQILDEVFCETQASTTSSDSEDNRAGAQVLIMVKDERTCAQLREFLALGEREMMRRRFGHFVLQRESSSSLRSSKASKGNNSARESRSLEQQFLFDTAAEFRALLSLGDTGAGGGNVSGSKGRNGKSKKRPLPDAGSVSAPPATEIASFGMSLEDLERLTTRMDQRSATSKRKAPAAAASSISATEIVAQDEQLVLCTYDQAAQLGATALLRDLQPRCVVMYDPDVAFIRELEVFHARQPHETALDVYFMLYADSAEQQTYLSEIQREKRAFEALIHQKAHLMMPANVYDVPYHVKAAQAAIPEYSMDTRTGGNSSSRSRVRPGVRVVVDVREFRSALPSMLHKDGLIVQPVTLEVGDYILSPQICVERKSISDLFGSLNSGRLFNQAENMGRFYELPVLLIEFSQGKAFSLQDASELGSEISATNIVSKLTLLVLHFPQLRLLWSRSPHATVELFRVIKRNQPEPDVAVAAAVGTGSSSSAGDANAADGGGSNAMSASFYNNNAVDVLRKLPGITDHNYRKVLARVRTLAELSRLSLEELTALLGQICGKRLHTFLHSAM